MALSLCRTTVDDSARELMEHGTAAFPIACYHDDLQAEPVPWHWHEELELIYVQKGAKKKKKKGCYLLLWCCTATGR